ncbi:MAG TPA: glycosyltransferase family 39 protein [Gemmatales bacterium]|nr:glycosyltransferase family 39 protein [Gemmatales bacterium]HMP58135.1 glycosyltransferase family 39 protein [Gemmatales bacterium]
MSGTVWRDRALVIVLGLAWFLPGLGGFALWEEDEAHNAGCTQEMIAADTWVVPTFNYVLRPDKPALLYWLQRSAFAVVGPSELGARLPSALASLCTLLLTYEIGRRWANRTTGLAAALMLGTMLMFGVLSKAATPDGLFIAAITACMATYLFSLGRGSSRWLVLYGLTAGLAILAKGPAGLFLPTGIIGLHLIWQRELKQLWSRHLLTGLLLLIAVALPWYLAVGIETRFQFWQGFFGQHNVGRFLNPMEGHGGGWWLQPLLMLATTAPWSAFLIWLWWGKPLSPDPVSTNGGDRLETGRAWLRPATGTDAVTRLLGLWLVAWVLFFSLAATKLPNYLVPAFVPLALLLGRVLSGWRQGTVTLPAWAVRGALTCFAGIGIAVTAGFVVASGLGDPAFLRNRQAPALLPLAWIGMLLTLGGLLAWRSWAAGQMRVATNWLAGSAAMFTLFLALLVPMALDEARAPKVLSQALNEQQVERDILLGCHGRYLPSMVFYTRHHLRRSLSDDEAVVLLQAPVQVFLVIGARDWQRLADRAPEALRIAAAHYDLKAGQELLLITNRPPPSLQVRRPSYNSDVALRN